MVGWLVGWLIWVLKEEVLNYLEKVCDKGLQKNLGSVFKNTRVLIILKAFQLSLKLFHVEFEHRLS